MTAKPNKDRLTNQHYYNIDAVRKKLQPKLHQAFPSVQYGRELLRGGYVYDALCHFGRAANLTEPVFRLYEERCEWDGNQTSPRYQRNYAAYCESQAIWDDAADLYDRLYGALKSPTTSSDAEMLAAVKSARPGQVDAFHSAERTLQCMGKAAQSSQKAGA